MGKNLKLHLRTMKNEAVKAAHFSSLFKEHVLLCIDWLAKFNNQILSRLKRLKMIQSRMKTLNLWRVQFLHFAKLKTFKTNPLFLHEYWLVKITEHSNLWEKILDYSQYPVFISTNSPLFTLSRAIGLVKAIETIAVWLGLFKQTLKEFAPSTRRYW